MFAEMPFVLVCWYLEEACRNKAKGWEWWAQPPPPRGKKPGRTFAHVGPRIDSQRRASCVLDLSFCNVREVEGRGLPELEHSNAQCG